MSTVVSYCRGPPLHSGVSIARTTIRDLLPSSVFLAVGQSTTIACHLKHSGWAFHSSAVMAKIQLPENPCQRVYGSHSELQPTNSSGKLKASIAGRGRNATYQLIW
jgi:hypothetical protein